MEGKRVREWEGGGACGDGNVHLPFSKQSEKEPAEMSLASIFDEYTNSHAPPLCSLPSIPSTSPTLWPPSLLSVVNHHFPHTLRFYFHSATPPSNIQSKLKKKKNLCK